MPIPWLTVLTSVPWKDVISNAPKVADGAKKLWKSVGKTSPAQEPPVENTETPLSPEGQTIATLQGRVTAMESAASELHGQMLASSELIKTLADQNTQLIALIEANRVRVAWLTGATIFAVIIAVMGLTLAFVR